MLSLKDRSRPLPRDRAIPRLLAEARRDSAEFPRFLANHLPMILVALQRLGAGEDRLQAYAESYRAASGLQPLPPAIAPIKGDDWLALRGERSREADLRAFFSAETARLGARAAQRRYLPDLLPGIAASALHALMRLAYADLADDEAEIGAALGYWAATYLPLAADAEPSAGADGDPVALLRRLKDGFEPEPVAPESDLLWHWMRAVAARPSFSEAARRFDPGPDALPALRAAALALMASTMTFEAVHALTGCHWLRLIAPACPDDVAALRGFWLAVAAVYPKIGMPALLSAGALDDLRHALSPDWPDIAARAVASDDEHDISLVFSAREEFALTGDPLYRVIAAKRVELI